MIIWAIARNTLAAFLRDKLLILFFILFLCVLLLMITPLAGMRAMITAANAQQMQAAVLGFVAVIMSFVSGCGSLLAAWTAADSVASEMKSGTILAVMARPVRRWEFLVGKYLAVLLLMVVYVLLMFVVSYLLAWLGGERIQSSPWVLLVYPLVRYAVYAAIAMLLVTLLHPVVSFGIVMALSVLALLVAPSGNSSGWMGLWLRRPLYFLLPSTNLLSESRFLSITQASLNQTSWLDHATALAYALDYAAVCLLLAMWSFHHRNLTRD